MAAGDDAPPDPPPPAAYGTLAQDAPVTRADLERAIRFLNSADLELRDQVLRLSGQVIALTDELVRRIDHVEPEPAAPGTPAPPATATVEAAVIEAMPHAQMMMRIADERVHGRVTLDVISDKYETPEPDIPCAELVHLCQARCCSFTFALSTQDLDEGVIRWDYGQPYLIRQRASDGYCVHHDPTSRACTVHAFRPRVCRKYDCRHDERIWIDFEKRIPAPPVEPGMREVAVDLMARAKSRYEAVQAETASIRKRTSADDEPIPGPPPDATRRRPP